jgi:uncharacterized membrane protein
LAAILVILVGLAKSLTIYARDVLFARKSAMAIKESRLELGHSLSLALGFLIAGSILKTTLAPTWDEIGQLAAIIAIRTILNYFLIRNIDSDSVAATPGTWKKSFTRTAPKDQNSS